MNHPISLPDTCTLLLSLDLTVQETIDQRTYLQTLNPDGSSDNSQVRIETTTTDSIDCLGKGGMGIVTKGTQSYPDRTVAIKKIIKKSRTYHQLLLHEAQIMGQLEHPNIVPVHQICMNDQNELMVVMKKVHGQTLDARLKELKTESIHDKISVIQILIQVCYALEYAHSKHIVHRDIKCENIMIGKFNEVFLMDWGLAFNIDTMHNAHSGVVGTPSYIAPEMLTGLPTDVSFQTDVYLLGATLHHILMNTPRHNKSNVAQALESSIQSVPFDFPSNIPTTFASIVNKACSKEKADRYQSVADFRDSLDEALHHWEAIQVTERAREVFISLQQKIETKAPSLELQTLFMKSRSLLESALEMWTGNEQAHNLLQDLLEAMIDHHLNEMELPLARMLYQDIFEPSDTLQQRFHQKEREYVELSEAQAIAQEYNPLQSKHGRRTLIVSLVASAVLLISFAGSYSYFVSSKVTTIRLIITGSIVFGASTVGVYVGRHSLLSNKLGVQMARTMVILPGLALFNHICGHVYQIDTNAIMNIDLCVIAVTYALLRDIIPSGYKIAGSMFVLAILSLTFPVITHLSLLFGILYSTLWALFDWMKE